MNNTAPHNPALTPVRFTAADIDAVDFTDPYDIGGYVALLSQKYAMSAASANRPTAEGNRLRHTADRLVRRLDSIIPRMTVADAFMTLQSYDFAFRLAYGRPAEHSLTDRITLDAFEAMIRGDRTIDPYDMYHTIRREVRNRNSAFLGRPLQWCAMSLERWFKDFRYTLSSTPLSDYDTAMTVSILLAADLEDYAPGQSRSFRQRLFDNHRRYLDVGPEAGRDMLRAAQALLESAAPFMTADEYTAHQEAILAALISSPATNRYLRAALTLSRHTPYN